MPRSLLVSLFGFLLTLVSCARESAILATEPSASAGSGPQGTSGSAPDIADQGCETRCSDDRRSVEKVCNGSHETLDECAADESCLKDECQNACQLAVEENSNVGCEYYAVNTDILLELAGSCFVSFVTNTFPTPAHLTLEFRGKELDIESFARLPQGSGAGLEYLPYDADEGLPPGAVALLFLSNAGGVPCPVPAARDTGAWLSGSGWGDSFRISSDVPVVAMQMLPYGGGSAAITGATLLLPTSGWGKNYVAVNAWPDTAALPSLNIVAMEDDTHVTMLPGVAVEGRTGLVPSGAAGERFEFSLQQGEFLQLSQGQELTGSAIESDKKIALFGGSQCMYVPDADAPYCDHAEQQIPPVSAMGSEYVAAPYRARAPEETSYLYRLVGAVDGTRLVFEPALPGAPARLAQGQVVELWASEPFVVKSQDAEHPFLVFSYMTGGELYGGRGDPDFVRVVSPEQYLARYVFFTDPTYPDTHLVVVRSRSKQSEPFADVELDCYGTLDGWEPVGDSELYEVTRVGLIAGDFEPQGKCDNGSHEMHSEGYFGVTVWSWGGPETTGGVCPTTREELGDGFFSCHVSYGYPAGESVRPLNDVRVPTIPK